MNAPGELRNGPGLCRQTLLQLRQEAARRADLMLALCALLPRRLGGAIVEGAGAGASAQLAARLAGWTPTGGLPLRLPVSITDDRLLGGLDLAATLAGRRPIIQPGILAAAHQRCLVIPMAERLSRRTAAQIAAVMDRGEVAGVGGDENLFQSTDFPLLLLSDIADPSESVPDILAVRLAFRLDGAFLPETWAPSIATDAVARARDLLSQIRLSGELAEAFARACADLGLTDIRILDFLCAGVAGIAALEGVTCVGEEHVALAAGLILGPRIVPAQEQDPPSEPPPEEPSSDASSADVDGRSPDDLAELVIASASYAASLDLARSHSGPPRRLRGEVAHGKSGDIVHSWIRGTRVDSRPGDPRRNGRLDLIATLRAAAPWQKIRPARPDLPAIRIQSSDFRLKRFRHRSETVVIFAVDASGSAAMNRLADAKGAVEYLLSGCYARRESVALLAFRRQGAELLLSPTRSLTRVKRSLAGLPGGGGTPLASGISLAGLVSEQERSRRRTPYVVFLSDGQANVALDGTAGRECAMSDAVMAARRLRAAHLPILFLDTSARPRPEAKDISLQMGAVYIPLPYSDPRLVSETVRSVLLA